MKRRLQRSGYCIVPLLTYLLALVASFVVYHRISLGVPRMSAAAHRHAAALIDLERRLGILFEPRIQSLALHHANLPVVGFLLNDAAMRDDVKLIYSGGQIPWLGSMLVWVLLFRPQVFRRICVLAIAGSLAGLLIAALYPVAPPRFALIGAPYHMQDVSTLISSEKDLVRFGGFDPYASMPSLHVFWALITAAGLFQSADRWGQRVLTFLFPSAIIASVIITGNHYVLDCVGAGVLFATCLACRGLYRRMIRSRDRSRAALDGEARVAQRLGRERRAAPDLRPLDFPMIFCAFTGMLLLPTADDLARVLGLFLLVAGALAPRAALKRIAGGTPLRVSAPTTEWFSGFLLVLGATTLGAADPAWRAVGSLIWTMAGLLPLLSRFGPMTVSYGAMRPWFGRFPLRHRSSRMSSEDGGGVPAGDMRQAPDPQGESRIA